MVRPMLAHATLSSRCLECVVDPRAPVCKMFLDPAQKPSSSCSDFYPSVRCDNSTSTIYTTDCTPAVQYAGTHDDSRFGDDGAFFCRAACTCFESTCALYPPPLHICLTEGVKGVLPLLSVSPETVCQSVRDIRGNCIVFRFFYC